MRPTTALLAGLLAHSVAAGPSSSCLIEKILEKKSHCHSSHSSELNACISDVVDNVTIQSLQACFEKAGCNSLDYEFEARAVFESCLPETELKKRQDEKDEENEDAPATRRTTVTVEEPTPEEESTQSRITRTTTVQAETTEEVKTKDEQTEEETTKEETTKEDTSESTSVEPKTTEESVNIHTEVGTTTVQAAAIDTPTVTTISADKAFATTSSLECFTTITFTTEGYDIVNTDANGRVSRSFNSQKVLAKTRCADGLVCRSDTCMVAENGLDPSGIAVAIFFGTAAAVSVVTLIFLCCRDRRKDKKLRAKMEAEKIAKESAKPAVVAGAGARSISANRRSPSGTDRQPLMNQGMYPPSPGGSQSGRASHDPFGDQRRL